MSNRVNSDQTPRSVASDLGLQQLLSYVSLIIVNTIFWLYMFPLLQCFDGGIVLASFIVDLVLLEGLQQFTVQEFVLILAFLVPWRIIRVVNSKFIIHIITWYGSHTL